MAPQESKIRVSMGGMFDALRRAVVASPQETSKKRGAREGAGCRAWRYRLGMDQSVRFPSVGEQLRQWRRRRRLSQLELAGEANHMVLGVVTGIHLRDDCLVNGRFDLSRTGWLSRMGYRDYAIVTELFEMERPA